ncbi:poly(A) RNA polymerase, mitochondrial-like [Argiope bruennichi]|uniref:poly(A) RNA polymerase, mitochondrial-like n=1 Tax=Argiope bruennichi TaxID=94029 RepID=UPI002493E857|nr:poly(A) RNA polymerase, mitochondrial-like [Argiope bruennichi]
MNMQKCLCSLTRKYTKLVPHAFGNKSHLRTYTFLRAEKKKFLRMRSSLSMTICPSAGLQTDLSAVKDEDVSKNNSSIHHQNYKFEDMSFDKPVPHEDLITALYKCKTISEQMKTLASTLSLCQDDVRNRIKFCRALELLFKPFFSDFKIQIFGSTVNGFGFKGCDIDLSFETPAEGKEKNFYIEPPDVPLVSEVTSGKVTPQQISELPPKEQLLFIHNVLLEYYRESEDAPIFINAHVPLVRFHHDKFGLKCDLTFKNKVAFANTKLLYLYHKLDNRVAPLMMTIRYWAKYLDIIGKGLMFNSYTISLMIIFFLQTRSPPILPSAESIIAWNDSFIADDMDDKSFLDILEKIPPSKNEQALDELLKEFFFFYLYFDFTQVICPMTAKAVPRKEFFSRSENSYFKMNTLCVQDPMCLSHNVAELVDHKYCRKLACELLVACNIFLNEDTLKPSTSAWGLISMLDTPQNYSFKRLTTSKTVSLSVPLLTKSIDGLIPESERMSTTADTLLKILDYAFLFSYRRLKTSEYLNLLRKLDELILKHKRQSEAAAKAKLEMQQIRQSLNKNKLDAVIGINIASVNKIEAEESMLEQFQKFNAENQLIFCAELKASKNIWQGRDLVQLDTVYDSKNILEKEHLISSLTAKLNDKREKTEPYLFLCECHAAKDKPKTLVLNFKPCKKLNFNPMLSTFLKQYIPYIMKKISE